MQFNLHFFKPTTTITKTTWNRRILVEGAVWKKALHICHSKKFILRLTLILNSLIECIYVAVSQTRSSTPCLVSESKSGPFKKIYAVHLMRLMSKLIRKRIKLHIVFVDGGKDTCFHNGTCSAVCVLYSVPIKLNFFVQFFSRHFRFCRTVCELELCAGSLKSLLVIHGDFNHHFVCLIFYWFYQMIYFNFLSPMDSRTINSHTNIHHITCGWKKNIFSCRTVWMCYFIHIENIAAMTTLGKKALLARYATS